jgi:hypothetical protein
VSGTATIVRGPDGPAEDSLAKERMVPEKQLRLRTPVEESRHRFTVAVVVGCGVALPLVLWVLWDLWWGGGNPLRAVPYDNFYDLQARAMFHGHLYLPDNKMGIEAFVHDGRQYTYFGIFPSLIRMPILLITSRLDGQLTAPSILIAWLCTGLASALLYWRLRILIRGQALVGRVEAVAVGAFMATIMGGSVILDLSATPFVYNEDFAWSVPLTLASLFALLGMLERPSRKRLVAAVVFISATNLNRTPAGYACVIGAFLVAGWFFLGKEGAANRRWTLPMAGVGVVAFGLNAAVTYAKFGIPIGLPMADQVWATVNAHRRYFLKANNGKAFSFAFLPSTLWAYLQPFGIHFTNLFPFITTPTAPAAARAGAVLDQTYPTASIPATMPLLFLLTCWGLVTSFRRRALGQMRLIRIVLVTAAAGAGGVVLWGYISERYMADFMPVLILAGAVGLIDICRRLALRPRTFKQGALGLLLIGTTYGVVANLAIAAFPVGQWSITQTARFVTAERDLTPGGLGSSVRTGPTLPYWAPAGQLFAVNHCSGLYLSTGDTLKDVPGQQIEHLTWLPVTQNPAFTKTIGFTFNRSERYLTHSIPLVKFGKSTLILEPNGPNQVRLVLENSGTSINWPPAAGWTFPINFVHAEYEFTTTIDPNLNYYQVTWYGSKMLGHYVAGKGTARVLVSPPAPKTALPVVTVAAVKSAPVSSPFGLCRSLVGNR